MTILELSKIYSHLPMTIVIVSEPTRGQWSVSMATNAGIVTGDHCQGVFHDEDDAIAFAKSISEEIWYC